MNVLKQVILLIEYIRSLTGSTNTGQYMKFNQICGK